MAVLLTSMRSMHMHLSSAHGLSEGCSWSCTVHICKGIKPNTLSKNAHNPVHDGCPQGSFCQGVREAQDHLRDREGPGRIESAAVLLEEDRQAPNLQGSQVD